MRLYIFLDLCFIFIIPQRHLQIIRWAREKDKRSVFRAWSRLCVHSAALNAAAAAVRAAGIGATASKGVQQVTGVSMVPTELNERAEKAEKFMRANRQHQAGRMVRRQCFGTNTVDLRASTLVHAGFVSRVRTKKEYQAIGGAESSQLFIDDLPPFILATLGEKSSLLVTTWSWVRIVARSQQLPGENPSK